MRSIIRCRNESAWRHPLLHEVADDRFLFRRERRIELQAIRRGPASAMHAPGPSRRRLLRRRQRGPARASRAPPAARPEPSGESAVSTCGALAVGNRRVEHLLLHRIEIELRLSVRDQPADHLVGGARAHAGRRAGRPWAARARRLRPTPSSARRAAVAAIVRKCVSMRHIVSFRLIAAPQRFCGSCCFDSIIGAAFRVPAAAIATGRYADDAGVTIGYTSPSRGTAGRRYAQPWSRRTSRRRYSSSTTTCGCATSCRAT